MHMSFLENQHPIIQALIATCFTWFLTALGAAVVFFAMSINRRMLDSMLGFASGVMIAASCWSLLIPAIEMSEGKDVPVWFPAVSGFLAGGVFLRLVDYLLPHLHKGVQVTAAEGIKTSWQRSTLLIMAVTLHNIPEGLAVGVAFGAADAGLPAASLAGAVTLAIGIGIQNLPEGTVVSMLLRGEGMSRLKSFWYGQLSSMVEPVAGVIGAAIVLSSQALLPYALSFAAGAMIFVVVEELIPESQSNGNTDLATLSAMLGFALMMALDVGFG